MKFLYGFVIFILQTLRYCLFFIMSILRGPIRFFCHIFIFSATIGIPVVSLGAPSTSNFKVPAVIFMIIGLLVCSAIQWFYDSLLLKLSTRDIYLPY